jgi:hypothetical protein
LSREYTPVFFHQVFHEGGYSAFSPRHRAGLE